MKIYDCINRFYVSRFSDLEQDYAHQENMECEQLAAFVATTQLLATCTHAKEKRRTLGMYNGCKYR